MRILHLQVRFSSSIHRVFTQRRRRKHLSKCQMLVECWFWYSGVLLPLTTYLVVMYKTSHSIVYLCNPCFHINRIFTDFAKSLNQMQNFSKTLFYFTAHGSFMFFFTVLRRKRRSSAKNFPWIC